MINPDMTNMTAMLLIISKIMVPVVAMQMCRFIPMTIMIGPITMSPPMQIRMTMKVQAEYS